MYESDTTGYSHYYRRCPQLTSYSSTSNETSTEYSSEEIKHIYDNRELSKEVCNYLSTYICFIFYFVHPKDLIILTEYPFSGQNVGFKFDETILKGYHIAFSILLFYTEIGTEHS